MCGLRKLLRNWEENSMVEWKKLGDVCSLQNGFAFKSGLFKDIGLPIIRITNISDRSVNLDDCKYFKLEDYKGVKLDDFIIRKGDILVAMSGATTGKIGIYNHNNISYLNQRVGKFIPHEEILENRYLYHFLLSQYQVIYIMAGGGAQPNLSSNKLLNDLLIPIPSKSGQERIVSILDTFTSSIANLKEQIKERRKQYEHYRDQLLDLEGKEGVEMKNLPQISVNLDSKRKPITSSKRKSGPYPYYGASGIVDYVEGYLFDGNYLLISEDGANLLARTTPIAFHIEGKNWVNNHAHVLAFEGLITQKYVEIYLNMIDLTPWINGAAQPKLNQDNLNRILIPIPLKQEQSRIVSILDQFEASIANLEAQLKEREKQYEYYRNQLLTFE